MFSSKAEARQWARAVVEAMSLEERRAASEHIVQSLIEFISKHAFKRIFLFAGKTSEPQVLSIASAFPERSFALPRVYDRETMYFHSYKAGEKLHANRWSILEPEATEEIVAPTKEDLLLVPCVAVTSDGRRLGHGVGFYDRYQAKLSRQPGAVGVAFQKVVCASGAWKHEDHDAKLDWIATELGVVGI